jgi:outer membrane lipoprotein-sorting protein
MIRKTVVVLSAIAALFCLSTAASAQTVDEVVAKNLAAKGGLEKLKAIETIRSTGTMSAQGQSITIISSSKRPNMTRQEMVMAGQTILMVFDGTHARMLNPMAGPTPVDVPAEQVEMIKDQSDIDGPLVDYKAKGTTIALAANETVDGKKAIHLVLSRKALPTQDVFLDGETYLEMKVTTTVPGSGTFETKFGDYRAVDGMTMPFSITTMAAGMTLSELKLDKIEINVKLDDSLFTIK